ncbi:hypothetical protein [Paraburkholderia sp. BCC1885]|uniref:hypothetical protein n=1 Tax=Paraburkholderia sp. BCC1885 TaxID=2562669 RepID=UPI0011834A79|nr:hypothetical protein [Paraburkholderia sp. BCC1885]
MSKQAFDALLEELDEDERTNIYAAAAAFGLSFDDPSWVPFAITRVTLADLKQEADEIADEIEAAADRALNKIDTRVQAVSEQARNVIETQAKALGNIHRALETLLAQGQERYRAELAKLDAELMQTLVSDSANEIARHVSASLTAHTTELEQSRNRLGQAVDQAITTIGDTARAVINSTRRKLMRALWGSTGATAICAGVAIVLMLFVSHHEAASNADLLRAYAAQRDELLKQIDGAEHLLTAQHTGQLSLRFYGQDLYLLSPGGIGDLARCGNSGVLGWLQPGGTPCVLIGRAG